MYAREAVVSTIRDPHLILSHSLCQILSFTAESARLIHLWLKINPMNRLSPRKWPDKLITTSGTPNQAPFSLDSLFYSSFPFSLSSPAVVLSGTDFDTLWHGSRAKLCCASIVLPVPQQPNVRQGPVRGPVGWLVSTSARGTSVSLPTFTILGCISSPEI